MKRRNLLIAGALIAVAIAVLRRRRRGVTIEIEEPDDRDRAPTGDVGTVDLESIDGIGPAYAKRLREAGVTDASQLVGVDTGALARESGIAEARIRAWVERARDRDGD